MMKKQFLLIVLILIVSGTIGDDDEDEGGIFVPTHEWQVVKKGQKIPDGLYVRINFQSGVTEAKIMDGRPKISDKSTAVLHLPQYTQGPQESKTVTQSQEAAKDDILSPDEIKILKSLYTNENELNKEMKKRRWSKRESRVMVHYINKYKAAADVEKPDKETLLSILEDLEFMAHEYYNAITFVQNNGLGEVVYRNLNSTDADLRLKALHVFTSAVQSNKQPQMHALESGAIGLLLRLITFDSDPSVKKSAITAASAFVRNFDEGRMKFIDQGGLSVITKAFEAADLKLQIKISILINDLFTSREYIGEYAYRMDIEKITVEHNWCENYNKLLHRLVVTDYDDHHSFERVLLGMDGMKEECVGKYSKNLIAGLYNRYKKLAAVRAPPGEEDDFGSLLVFHVLRDISGAILKHIDENHNSIKTEL